MASCSRNLGHAPLDLCLGIRDGDLGIIVRPFA